jgi:hypothetical protein
LKQQTIIWALLVGGTIAGTLDILFAISFAGYNGMPATKLLQTVASGALGKTAFDGGVAAAATGLACHFALSYLWTALFLAAAWRLPALLRRPAVAGILFGILVFLAMRLIVLPLSAFPFPVKFKPLGTVLDLMSHMFFFGLPIAIAASKTLLARAADRTQPAASSA